MQTQSPAGAPLNSLQKAQERCWGDVCLNKQHGIEIRRLPARPERRRRIYPRRPDDAKASAQQLAACPS
jgi:hypothetical protein